MRLLNLYIIISYLLLFTISCTENGVDDDSTTGNASEYISHSFLLFTNESIEFQTNEYVKASWENRNSFFVEIDNLDSNGADYYINTYDNFIEFPSNLSPNDDYKFDKDAIYTIKAWSYHTSDEIRNDQSTVIVGDLSISVTVIVDSTKDSSVTTIKDSSIAIICIMGNKCTDSTNLKKLSPDASKYVAIDTLYEVVGQTITETDSGDTVTIDIIDTFFVLSNKDYNIKKEIRVVLGDTLTFYSDDNPSPATFTFKNSFLPSPEINSIIKKDSTLLVFLAEDSTDSFAIIVEDLLTNNLYSKNINGDDTASFSGIVKNSAYKISAVINYGSWLGNADSIYSYGIESFMLPYKYYSTFEKPTQLSDSNYIPVKGGIFIMGDIWESDFSNYSPGARPAHEVVISSFHLSKNEISVGEYCKFLDTVNKDINQKLYLSLSDSSLILNSHKLAFVNNSSWHINVYADTQGNIDSLACSDSTLSLMSVTWEGAALYCNWLTSKDTTLSGCYKYFQDTVNGEAIAFWKFNESANGYRLPTEAEWEFVASQATDSTKNKFYEGSIFVNLSDQAEEWVTDVNDKLFGDLNDSSSYYAYSLAKGIIKDPCNRNRDRKGNISRGAGLNSSSYEKQTFYRHFNFNSWNINAGFRIARNE